MRICGDILGFLALGAGTAAIVAPTFAYADGTLVCGATPCSPTLANAEEPNPSAQGVAKLLISAFGGRVTDTLRPMNATYGALHSWHKYGQAVDFVPDGGVGAINRDMIRRLMAANGIRIIELLGPGDRGHSNHWHVAFARPGQLVPTMPATQFEEEWNMARVAGVAPSPNAIPASVALEAPANPASLVAGSQASAPNDPAPPSWDVFAVADWRARHGDGS